MTGIHRATFKTLNNLDSAYQSVQEIFLTEPRSRVMLRHYGLGLRGLLGKKMSPKLFAVFQQLVGTAIDLWEPRVKVRKVSLLGSIEDLRRGHVKLRIEADYRPKAHHIPPDYTVTRGVEFILSASNDAVTVKSS